MFSFSSGFYSQSLCTLFNIRLFAASLQKSVDWNFGSHSSSLEVQQRLLNQSRWGGPVRNPGLVSARATDHGEQNQLQLTGEGNLRSRFPHGHWKETCTTHTDKCAQEMKVLSHRSDTENTIKWGCCHAAQCSAGDRVLHDWVCLAFWLQCFELKWWNWEDITWFGWRLLIVLE